MDSVQRFLARLSHSGNKQSSGVGRPAFIKCEILAALGSFTQTTSADPASLGASEISHYSDVDEAFSQSISVISIEKKKSISILRGGGHNSFTLRP